MWAGVCMVAAGSLALRAGLARDARPTADRAAVPSRSRARLEPELLEAVPRKVAITTRGKLVVAAWILALTTFGALAQQHFYRLAPIPSQELLDADGAAATAEFHSVETRELEDGRRLHFVGYSFESDTGSPVRINRSVPRRLHSRIFEGMTTEVVYLPGRPELHYLPDLTSPVSTRVVFFVGGLLLAAAGFAEAQRRLHRRLVSRGVAVPGFTASVRRRGGVRSFHVNFDADGERRSIRASERNPSLRSGQTATVLYDPASSKRAIVYRLALYRAKGSRAV